MPFEKVEFEFPNGETETEEEFEIEVEGSSAKSPYGEDETPKDKDKAEKTEKAEDSDDIDIEVVDDTPPEDRGRKPSPPPDDVTDDELEEYSEKVQKRIKHFSKGYHDERRAKEQAIRERQELEAYARKLVEENKRLQGTVGQSQSAMFKQAKHTIENELKQAKTAYKEAYDSGNSDAVLEAQERLITAHRRSEQLATLEKRALQDKEAGVQQATSYQNVEDVQQQTRPIAQPDEKAAQWAKENSWFGQAGKDDMTAFALGYHQKLVNEGVDPTSDQYYERLNTRMRQVFPEEFGESAPEAVDKSKQRRNVVAPATRSTAPKKVKLTQTQVSIAKRLGVPLDQYAKQVAIEMRKQNG